MFKTIVIRHTEDEDDPIHRHDNELTRKGKRRAAIKGRYLVKRYGEPDIILCSPMHRTRHTVKYMCKSLKSQPEVIVDVRLSRYFGSSNKYEASLFETTKKYKVPISETRKEFNNRCDSFVDYILQNREKFANMNVWIVTHTLVIDRMFRRTGKKAGYVEFLQHYILRY